MTDIRHLEQSERAFFIRDKKLKLFKILQTDCKIYSDNLQNQGKILGFVTFLL